MRLLRLFSISFVASLLGCATASIPAASPLDQVPMYGGVDRSSVAELKQADDKLIADVTAKFGSAERASDIWVEQGFRFYQQDRLDMAMRRFNQAWLLNPSNPEVYTGFASVLMDQSKYCEAQKLLELGSTKGSFQDGFLPDAALIFTLCAAESTPSNPVTKGLAAKRADEMLAQAYGSPMVPRSYTLTQWIRVLYVREDYRGAWNKVFEHRKIAGKDVDAVVLQHLRSKMPEPRNE